MGTARTVFLAVAMFAPLAFGAGAAGAAPGFMPGSDRTTQPIGHYEFCQREPQECAQKTSRRNPVELTRTLWAALVDINNNVNTSITPRTDLEMWGREEVWSYPDGEGDCEDYVLEKRRQLLALGVPASDLMITVVRQRNGEGHAVLMVRTDRGDLVLDNQDGMVRVWTETPYQYIKRQSQTNAGKWVDILDSRVTVIAQN